MRWIVRDSVTGLTWHHNAQTATWLGHAMPPTILLGPLAGAHRFVSRDDAEDARDRWRAMEGYTSADRAADIEVEEVE